MRRYFEIDGFPENLTAKDLAAFITSARFAITSKLDSIRELGVNEQWLDAKGDIVLNPDRRPKWRPISELTEWPEGEDWILAIRYRSGNVMSYTAFQRPSGSMPEYRLADAHFCVLPMPSMPEKEQRDKPIMRYMKVKDGVVSPMTKQEMKAINPDNKPSDPDLIVQFCSFDNTGLSFPEDDKVENEFAHVARMYTDYCILPTPSMPEKEEPVDWVRRTMAVHVLANYTEDDLDPQLFEWLKKNEPEWRNMPGDYYLRAARQLMEETWKREQLDKPFIQEAT